MIAPAETAPIGTSPIPASSSHSTAAGAQTGSDLDGVPASVLSRVVGSAGVSINGEGSLTGTAGADVLTGGAHQMGGAGDDILRAGSASAYLRGEDGADTVVGGAGNDDIHGNAGADSASGGDGDDWVVGGKDADWLSGEAGSDIVLGNTGADTASGGAGNDLVRGGQDNDVLSGDAGDDWLSGDRGSDTLTGGAGADIFHGFGEAGLDLVADFNAAEGDRVQLDAGAQYQIAQVGGNVVISIAGGSEMVLADVSLSSLPQGWLFVA